MSGRLLNGEGVRLQESLLFRKLAVSTGSRELIREMGIKYHISSNFSPH